MEQLFMNDKNTETEITINKSRFISSIHRTNSEDEAKAFIAAIKTKYKDANHHCSAYIIGESALVQRADDDGEPSGTAGVPMLEVLKREELYNVTVVVTRYFGGIKLGSGGLIRAYSKGASSVVQDAGKVYIVMKHPVTVTLGYSYSDSFEYYLNQENIMINNTEYTDKVTYSFHVDEKTLSTVTDKLKGLTSNQFDMTVDDLIESETPLTNFE